MIKDLIFKLLGLHNAREQIREIRQTIHSESVITAKKVRILNSVIEDKIGRSMGVFKETL